MLLDVPINIDTTSKYVIVSQHRMHGYSDKSRWLASMKEEVDCFIQSLNKKWLHVGAGWGVILDDANKLKVLGVNYVNENSKIAKFVDGNNSNLWHGYPADLKRKVKDIPPISILNKWRGEKIIKKHHISRIQRGVTCTL